MRCCALLLLALISLGAAERNGVRVEYSGVSSGQTGVYVVTLTPTRLGSWHLYGFNLPPGAVGFATRVELLPGGGLEPAGAASSDTPLTTLTQPGLPPVPVFVDGPVRVQVPYAIVANDGQPPRLRLNYMACSHDTCLPPVKDWVITLDAPAPPAQGQGAGTVEPPPPLNAALSRLLLADTGQAPPSAVAGAAGLDWHPATTPAEAAALIREAHAAGAPLFLDISGRYCSVCKVNERTHFPAEPIRSALAGVRRVHIDTDDHPAMQDWQRAQFGTEARPFYVLITEGSVRVWNDSVLSGKEAAFAEFLRGGAGRDLVVTGLLSLLLASVLGGLFTLLMPCTYPMIPLTINFFSKQAAGGRRLLPLALAYGGGIAGSFVALGIGIGLLADGRVNQLGASPWVNLGIALLFLALGFSMLGLFFLRLPAGWSDRLGAGGGYAGALLMGLTFAITAFTCTAPVAGFILASAATSGDWGTAAAAMGVYGATIACPFIVLALVPGLLQRLPRAGAWMVEFKYVGGLIEVAAAFKFLYSTAAAWGLGGILTREAVFGIWALAAALCALLIAGLVEMDDLPQRARPGLLRWLWVLLFAGLAAWLLWGVAGGNLGLLEGFLVG